jgi:hypothetical protein
MLDGFKRLQFCFKKKHLCARVDRIAEEIGNLDQILNKERSLEASRRSKQSSIANVFDHVRIQASSLHRAIVKAWRCRCKETHSSNLLLERQAKTESVFGKEAKSRKLRVTFLSKNTTGIEKSGKQYFNAIQPWHVVRIITASMITEKTPRMSLSQDRLSVSNPTIHRHQSVQPRGSVSPSLSNNSLSTKDDSSCTPTTTITTPESEPVIKDLCDALKGYTLGSSFLGYVHDELDNTYHILHIDSPNRSNQLPAASIISLRDLLCLHAESTQNGNERLHELSRAERLSVALVLAYSVLEFYSSPWLFKAWKKDDIYFFTDEHGKVMTDRLFILSENPKIDTSNQCVSSSQALEALGILILELWFNSSLESQPSWKRCVMADGLENEYTSQSAAMAWQRKAQGDGGHIFHAVTRRCIYGDFGLPSQGMKDKEFIRAVYEGVVLELEKLLAMLFQESKSTDVDAQGVV